MKIDFKNSVKKVIYEHIQHAPLSISEKELSQIFDRSRFDARLFEITTEFVRDFWWSLDAEYLNKNCKKAQSSFVVKCVLSCIYEYCKADTLTRAEYLKWMALATRGIPDPTPQLFLVAGYNIASAKEQEQVVHGLDCFRRHKVFYADLPFNKTVPGALKSMRDYDQNKINEIDLIKIKSTLKIKKLSHIYKNYELIEKIGINRLFLSKVLNNKTDRISAEYLMEVASACALI
jgi:hypothetical protein